MADFERYNKLHDEVMKRLEVGEITTEQAKDVIDMSFEKYIFEYVDGRKPGEQLPDYKKRIKQTRFNDLCSEMAKFTKTPIYKKVSEYSNKYDFDKKNEALYKKCKFVLSKFHDIKIELEMSGTNNKERLNYVSIESEVANLIQQFKKYANVIDDESRQTTISQKTLKKRLGTED